MGISISAFLESKHALGVAALSSPDKSGSYIGLVLVGVA